MFDFFAGPGTDSVGTSGSPLRLLREISRTRRPAGGGGPRLHLHLFDAARANIAQLQLTVPRLAASVADLEPPDIRQLRFHDALREYASILTDSGCAKLLFIDQCGVDQVPDDVFLRLVDFPTTDFLFFISSSTLNRFNDHPAIKQKIQRPDDSHHVHRVALEYYRSLLPDAREFWLAPFSIRKRANIYGVIFGSGHPLGMDEFLEVAWKQDPANGEANFDINRDNIIPGQLTLFGGEAKATKVRVFEQDLENRIRSGAVRNELDVIRICFDHGVRRSQARPVLAALRREGAILLDFRVPDIRRRQSPRAVHLVKPSTSVTT